MSRARGFVAGSALGVNGGFNTGNIGAIASELSRAYGVGLATIGLFTSALFLTHMAMQVPGGRASDRFGPARAGALGLGLIVAGGLVAVSTPDPVVAILARGLTGVGTGLAFICGSAIVRESGGSPFAQGLFGGIALAAGGVALATVPQLVGTWHWRTPYWTSLSLAVAGLAIIAVAGRGAVAPGQRAPGGTRPPSVMRDRRLYRPALLYSASFGLSAVLGNWAVELLSRHTGLSHGVAALVVAFPLVAGIATRPLGGWMLRRHPRAARPAVAVSIAGGAAGTLLLLAAGPGWVAFLGGLLVGAGAGIPFPGVHGRCSDATGRAGGVGRLREHGRSAHGARGDAARRAHLLHERRRAHRLRGDRGALACGPGAASRPRGARPRRMTAASAG